MELQLDTGQRAVQPAPLPLLSQQATHVLPGFLEAATRRNPTVLHGSNATLPTQAMLRGGDRTAAYGASHHRLEPCKHVHS
eukprot:4833135-Lingulodinium_polyedra.AAC.1